MERIRHWWKRPAGGSDVFWLALPLVISTSSWTIMQFADRMFLLWHSQEEMAAALPSGVLWFAVLCLPQGIALYVNAFVAQYHGAQRPSRIGPAVWQGVWIGVLAAPLVWATTWLAPWLFAVSEHPQAVIPLEIAYYNTLCYGATPFIVSAALASFFTGRGNSRTVMLVDCAASALNIVLDYLWIFGYGGFPEWGIAGAGWATSVSLWAKMFVYLWLFLGRDERREFATWSGCQIDWALFKRLLRYGFPSGLRTAVDVTGFTAFLMMLGRLGEFELTVTNIAFNVSWLAFVPLLGMGIATTTLVGQHLGREETELAARSCWSAYILATAYMLILSVLYVATPNLFLGPLLANVENPAALRETAIVLLWFVALYGVFDSATVIFVSALQGAGDTRFILWVSLVLASLMVAVTWFCMNILGWGLIGAWTIITGWVCAMGMAFLGRFLQGKWRSMRVIEESPAPDLISTPPQEELQSIAT